MNLYFIRHLLDDGSGDNLDWHVIASTPRQARDLWASFVDAYMYSSDGEDTVILTGDDADHLHPVLDDVQGPARVLPWRHA